MHGIFNIEPDTKATYRVGECGLRQLGNNVVSRPKLMIADWRSERSVGVEGGDENCKIASGEL